MSRNHAVLTRYDDGSWTITDAGSKDGTLVNGRKVQICALKPKDRISIGGVEMQLQPITQRQDVRAAVRIIPSHEKWPTEADPSSVPGDIRQRFQKQFSRPMTGHTPRKLPFFNAISRIIAVHAQNLPTHARL